MSLQEFQVHFFERLSSELGFGSEVPELQELMRAINSSQSTHLIYTNLSSGETLEGSFYLEKNLLVYQEEALGLPKIILDLSYARLHTIIRCHQKPVSPKILLEKNHNTYEIVFDDKTAYDYWMLKLRKACILTDFEKKYQVAEITDKRGDLSECLLETKMGGNNFSARKFNKKQMNASVNSLTMIHLMNEIEILRALRKKRVLNLQEVHETEDSVYLVTDCVHNLTLKKMLRAASSPFAVAKTKTIIYQLLKVLAHMASKKIVHRNLKPSSILMEDKHSIRIINFGLATYMNGPKANVGICGTPGYIAPEILNFQNESRVYDDKADVFSVGCIFFEMLFGYPLFEGSKTSELSTQNKNFKYSDLVQLVMKEQNSSKPHSTKLGLDLLLKLLHNDPKQRISAEEALHDLYFESRDSSPPKKFSMDESDSSPSPRTRSRSNKGRLGSNSPRNRSREKKISFDISSNASTSLRGSFSELVSHHEKSTLCPSNTSFAKLARENSGKCISPSSFRNQPKFKSAEEMKLPTPPKRLNDKISTEIVILPKINFTLLNEEEEESSDIFDESSSPMSLPQSHPITPSSGIKSHSG